MHGPGTVRSDGGAEPRDRGTRAVKTHHGGTVRSDGGAEPREEGSWSGSLPERRVAALFETTEDPILECGFVDGTARTRRTNDAFHRTFGVDPAAGDEPVGELLEDDGADDFPECTPHYAPVQMAVERATVDGLSGFTLRIEPLGPTADGDDHRQLVVYRDTAAPKAYDSKLEALHEATRELIQQDTKEGVVRSAVDTAVDALAFRASSVHLLDEEREVLVPTVTTERMRDVLGELPDLPPGESLAWTVYETGERAVFGSLSENPDACNPDSPIESELIAPLGDHGVFLAGSTTSGAFSDADVSLATILASNTEAALDRIEREEAHTDRERELERKNERLETFAGMVSHDLRNPLNVAQGRLELARADEDLSALDAVADAHDRMERLIDDLLELARQGEDIGNVDPLAVDAVARDAWLLVCTGDATLEIVEEIGTAPADRSRLSEALENLFRNAVEHCEDDVTVRIGPTTDGFYVEDDGQGIPAEDRERVFEVGYTGLEGGTGIGLAIVDDVATAHGWDVSLMESVDGGARFEFAVPSLSDA